MVIGRLRPRSWETPEGDKRSVVEVEAARSAPPSWARPRTSPSRWPRATASSSAAASRAAPGDPEGDKRSVTEIEADEVGASLKWATAKVERTSQRGNGAQPGRERQAERGGDFNDAPPTY